MSGAPVEFRQAGLQVNVSGPPGAPVVVLVHAISTGLHFWDLQVPVWSRYFRVVRFDLRGHGRSDAPVGTYGFEQMADDVLGVLDHLKVEKAAVVGLSLGGMIAQAVALKAPGRLAALVLAQTSARTPVNLRDMWRQRIAAATTGGMETQLEGSLSRWFTPDFRARAPLTVEWIAGLVRQTDAGGFIACCQAIEMLDFFDRLPKISAPTLVVAGAEDMAAQPANLQAIAGQIAGAEFAVIDKAAHFANIEQATEFTERVGAFLRARTGS